MADPVEVTIAGKVYLADVAAGTIKEKPPEPELGEVWEYMGLPSIVLLVAANPYHEEGAPKRVFVVLDGGPFPGSVWSAISGRNGIFGRQKPKDFRRLGTFQEWLRTKCASPCG